MKIFATEKIAEIDRFTMDNEPIAGIDLMERAANQMVHWLLAHISADRKLVVFAGPGHNGGDALAIARMMAGHAYRVEVFLLDFGKGLSGAPAINWQRLEEQKKVPLRKISHEKEIPAITESDVVIDGLFGSGLSRSLEGLPAAVVRQINQSKATVVAVDIPSGLMGEDNSNNHSGNIVQADFTLTLQFPKISFFFAENEKYTGFWEVLPIGLHPEGIRLTPTDFYFTGPEDLSTMIPRRSRFAHKGTLGHALLIAGSYGKMGAAVLASRGCLRAGAGLLTTHIPGRGYPVIQTAVPEAMASVDPDGEMITQMPPPGKYTSVGLGPGLGTAEVTQRALLRLLEQADKPLVIDADALNILSEHPAWLKKVPPYSILTPHPGEFRRLAGESPHSWDQVMRLREFAVKYRLNVVLKGAFTTVASPAGKLFFNATGNPGMATAGSGDALTGIILGLLVQGLDPTTAARAGVYIHGLAADLAVKKYAEEALIAGDILDTLGEAFLKIKNV
jgi:ADP-dependent NAD(P)H-hydrate dehydratase / NAD(P)H-hydrate epimerase